MRSIPTTRPYSPFLGAIGPDRQLPTCSTVCARQLESDGYFYGGGRGEQRGGMGGLRILRLGI